MDAKKTRASGANGELNSAARVLCQLGKRGVHDGVDIHVMIVEADSVDQLVDWRMEKKQHMRWTKRGAQMLLHVCCALLNGELSKYSGWSPLESSPIQAVAA